MASSLRGTHVFVYTLPMDLDTWLERNHPQGGRRWLMRVSGVSFERIKRALEKQPLGRAAAQRISEATSGEVPVHVLMRVPVPGAQASEPPSAA